MILAKLKTAAALVAVAAWSLVPTAAPAVVAAPVPKAKADDGVIFVASFVEKHGLDKKGLRVFRPDGTVERDVTPDGPFQPHRFRVSPAGRQVAFTESLRGNAPRKIKGGARQAVRVLALDGSGAVQTLADEAYWPFLAWAANGQGVYLSEVDPARFADAETKGSPFPFRTRLIDPATGRETPVALPPEHAVIDVSADGRTALTISIVVGTNEWGVHLVPLATMKPETIREPGPKLMLLPRLSPDGQAVLGVGSFAHPKEAKGTELYVYDVATKKESRIELPKDVAKADRIELHAWSPDGKRIVFSWREEIPMPKNPHRRPGPVLGAGPPKWYGDRITACDRDGSNSVPIFHADDNEEISAIEWVNVKLPDPKPADGPKSEAEKLIPKLGDADFGERQAAEKRLRELGMPALAALKAGRQTADPEIARRCENRRYDADSTVLVSDVSLAAQLILHGKQPADFGFYRSQNVGDRGVDRSCFAYGFSDHDATRKAAHDKAVAFLKTAPPPKAKAATDRDQLQGRWKLVESDDSGRVGRENGYTKNVLTFAGDKLTTAHGRDVPAPALPFKLDEAATPKRIDFQSEGKKSPQDRLGIYRLDGDKLTVCSSTVVPVRPELRPTDFTVSETNGRLLSVYERMKDDDPRWVAEWFAGHALAGRADVAEEVLADADEKARLQKAERFQGEIDAKTLKAPAVWVDATTGRTVAVSEEVKLRQAQPDGTDKGQLVFSLVKAKAVWRIKDIDFRTADKAKEAVDKFRKKNPDAAEAKISGKP